MNDDIDFTVLKLEFLERLQINLRYIGLEYLFFPWSWRIKNFEKNFIRLWLGPLTFMMELKRRINEHRRNP